MEIWIEKKRPRNFDEIIGQDAIVRRIKAMVDNKSVPHLLFTGPAGSGKCVCSNTPILDGDGNLLSIEEAYNKKIDTVMGLNKEGKITKNKVSYFYKGFSKETYKVKTNFGTEINVTPEHPFLILKEGELKWIEAKNLKRDMHIASPEILERKSTKEYKLKIPKKFKKEYNYYYYFNNGKNSCKINIPNLDKNYYYWLGLVFGDGNFRNANIRFYNTKDYMREKFKELSYQIYGNKIEIKEFMNKCPYVEIRKATTIVNLLEYNLGYRLCKKKSDIIKVPQELYTSNLLNISSFIRGLYETDGSFYSSCIEIASMSKDLLMGLRYLLLNFGISSRIKKKRVLISGSHMLKLFRDKIKPTIKIPKESNIENTNYDVLNINKKDIFLLFRIFGISREEIGDNFNYILERSTGSRKNVQQFYNKLTEIIRKRIELGIEAISILNNAKLHIEPDKLFELLGEKGIRKNIEIIREDRLKEYYNKKRVPTLRNYLRLIKRLYNMKMYSNENYDKVINFLVFRKNVLNILNTFKISYNEIGSKMNIAPGNINYILNNDGISLQSLNILNEVFIVLKNIIENKIFNEKCINIIENINFLKEAKIIWDKIKDIEVTGENVVYDLNIEEVHNFIGGNSPLVLHNTTLSLVLAKELYGNSWRENFLELNASDERGIDVVRNTIKNFARTKPIGNVPFKIIYLDECDSLTKEAQQALRRTMENYASVTRFCLSCNYSSKIIDPIQSRCTIFRFRGIEKEDVFEYIDRIAKQEELRISKETKEILYENSNGDLRRLLNILQSCASISNKIDDKLIYEIVSEAHPKEIKKIIEYAIMGDFLKSKNMLLDIMLKKGLSGLDVIKQIQKEVFELSIDEKDKLKLIEKCGEIEFRMVEGSDEFIQLQALLAGFNLR